MNIFIYAINDIFLINNAICVSLNISKTSQSERHYIIPKLFYTADIRIIVNEPCSISGVSFGQENTVGIPMRERRRTRRRWKRRNKKEKPRIVTVWWYLQQVLSGCSTWKHLIWRHCGRDSDYYATGCCRASTCRLDEHQRTRSSTTRNPLGAKGTPLMNAFRRWRAKIRRQSIRLYYR